MVTGLYEAVGGEPRPMDFEVMSDPTNHQKTNRTNRGFSFDENSGPESLQEAPFEPYTPYRSDLILMLYLGPPGWVLVCGCTHR